MTSSVSVPFQIPSIDASFSSASMGLPIATVCPDTGSAPGSAPFEFISLPTVSSRSLTDLIVSASALLPGGSMTTFSSLSRRDNELSSAPKTATTNFERTSGASVDLSATLATIVLGSDRCQTLYRPSLTAACLTTVTPGGLPPVIITDCDQYITFSSETLFSCAPTSTINPRPAGSTTSIRNLRADVDDSFTTRPFPPDYTSSTLNATSSMEAGLDGAEPANATNFDGVDTSVTTSISSQEDAEDISNTTLEPEFTALPISRRDLTYSTAPSDDIPMSLPRHLLPENQLRKRQLLISKGKPFSTDLITVTPSMTPSMLPPTPMRIPRALNLVTGIPKVPDPLAGVLNGTFNSTSNGTYTNGSSTDAVAAIPVITRLFPIPAVLRAKYARNAVRAVFHKRQIAPLPSPTTAVNITVPEVSANLTSIPNTNITSSMVLPSSIPVNASDSFSLATSDVPANRLANLSPPQPTKYYAAPWQEIAQGGVPTHVRGITCRGGLEPAGSCVSPDTDGDTESCECETADELWSVTSLTRTRVGTTVVGFTGDAVVKGGAVTSTTRITFKTTLTTTRSEIFGSVVRSVVSDSGEGTVYATTQTSFPSLTMTLLPGDAATSMEQTVDAAMPQGGVGSAITDSILPSISYPTDVGTGTFESASILRATKMASDFPVSSISMPVADIEGTVLVTSMIATKTVTVPSTDGEDTGLPVLETSLPLGVAPGVQVPPGGEPAAREVWPTDVWLADVSGTPVPIETAYLA